MWLSSFLFFHTFSGSLPDIDKKYICISLCYLIFQILSFHKIIQTGRNLCPGLFMFPQWAFSPVIHSCEWHLSSSSFLFPVFCLLSNEYHSLAQCISSNHTASCLGGFSFAWTHNTLLDSAVSNPDKAQSPVPSLASSLTVQLASIKRLNSSLMSFDFPFLPAPPSTFSFLYFFSSYPCFCSSPCQAPAPSPRNKNISHWTCPVRNVGCT